MALIVPVKTDSGSKFLDQPNQDAGLTTRASEIRLAWDSQKIKPSLLGNSHRFVLPGDVTEFWLLSRSVIPKRLNIGNLDERRLGIMVSNLAINGKSVPLTDPCFREGWHFIEQESWRWTDGCARIILPPGVKLLDVELQQADYPVSEVACDEVEFLVDFGVDGNSDKFVKEGWSWIENDYRWTEGRESILVIPKTLRAGCYLLRIMAFPCVHPRFVPRQRFSIVINRVHVGDFELSDPRFVETVFTREIADINADTEIKITLPDATRPCEFLDGGDERCLGLGFSNLRLIRCNAPLPAGGVHKTGYHVPPIEQSSPWAAGKARDELKRSLVRNDRDDDYRRLQVINELELLISYLKIVPLDILHKGEPLHSFITACHYTLVESTNLYIDATSHDKLHYLYILCELNAACGLIAAVVDLLVESGMKEDLAALWTSEQLCSAFGISVTETTVLHWLTDVRQNAVPPRVRNSYDVLKSQAQNRSEQTRNLLGTKSWCRNAIRLRAAAFFHFASKKVLGLV